MRAQYTHEIQLSLSADLLNLQDARGKRTNHSISMLPLPMIKSKMRCRLQRTQSSVRAIDVIIHSHLRFPCFITQHSLYISCRRASNLLAYPLAKASLHYLVTKMSDPAQVNRSLSTIRTELEYLASTGLLSPPQFQSIQAQLPVC